MSERPPPLPDDLLDLLDAERDVSPAPTEVRERMFARLAPFIVPIVGAAGGDGGAGAGGSGGAGAGGSSGAGAGGATGGPSIPDAGALGSAASVATATTWGGKIITIVVSAALGAAGGAATHAALVSTPPAPQVATVTPVAPAVEEQPRAVEPTPPVAETITPTDPALEATRPRPPKPVASPKPSPSDLRAERLLVETASAALVRGDHASALATLRSHVAKYPRGALVEEREVLMIQALAASGDKDAAKRRAQAFRRDFPGSLQLGAVNKAAE